MAAGATTIITFRWVTIKTLDNLVRNQYDRITLTANNSFSWLKKKLELNAGIIYTDTRVRNNNFDPSGITYPYLDLVDDFGNALTVPRDIRQPYKDTVRQIGCLIGIINRTNELKYSDNSLKTSDYRINAEAKYAILKGLDLMYFTNTIRDLLNRKIIKASKPIIPGTTLINLQIQARARLLGEVPLGGILDQRTNQYEAHNTRLQLNFDHNWYNPKQNKTPPDHCFSRGRSKRNKNLL